MRGKILVVRSAVVSLLESQFFAEKDSRGKLIDYHAVVGGKLQLVPGKKARATLEEDYRRMLEDGLLFG